MSAAGRRALGVALAAAGLALIAGLTLTPVEGPDTGTFQWCVRCGDVGLSDFVANVALFVPLALGLLWAGVTGRRVFAASVLLAAVIEIAQLWIPGRQSTLGDVVAAGVGAGAAALAWHRWPTRRSAPAGLLATALIVAVIAGIGVALSPSFPATRYYGEWTAEKGRMERYRGRVLDAEIAGLPLPDGPAADSPALRERLAAGAPLTVHAIAGPRTARLAPLFGIADADGRGIRMLGIDGSDLVLRVYLRAADAYLIQPDLRWRGALAGVNAGDPLAVTVRRASGSYCLAVNGRERCGLGYTVGRGWTLVHDVPGLPAAGQLLLDCVFMALLALPVGALLRANAAGAVAAAAALAAVAVLPMLAGLLPTPASQLGASAVGLAAGALTPGGSERADAPIDAGVR